MIPLFWLAAAPALSGATLRIFYSFIVPLVVAACGSDSKSSNATSAPAAK